MTTVSLNKTKLRGKVVWMVSRRELGKLRRSYFHSKVKAEALVEELEDQANRAGTVWLGLSAAERNRLIDFYGRLKAAGWTLEDVLERIRELGQARGDLITLGKAIAELKAAKLAAGRAKDYVATMGVVLNQFAAGREETPLVKIGFEEVHEFVLSKKLDNRATVRSRLSTLFKFCVRRRWRADNPCERLEHFTVAKKLPQIFSMSQMRQCLAWLRAHPKLLGWFVLTTLAGLRPEEAEKTEWSALNLAENFLRVEAQTTKVRQRRVVYPPAAFQAWMIEAKRLKTILPIPDGLRRRQLRALKKYLGWDVWPKDITRHTAASMWLALDGSADRVAGMLGHSERTLKKNYLALVTREGALEFWTLRPARPDEQGCNMIYSSQA